MPPRRAAKKKTPAKKAAPKSEAEETPSSVIEEETAITQASGGEKNQESVFKSEEVSVTTTTTTTVVVEESKVTQEITEEQKSEIEGLNASEDAMVVAEEFKVTQEKELKVSCSSSVNDITMVENASVSMVVEESKVTEGTVEEKKLEIEGSGGAEDVVTDGDADEPIEGDGEDEEEEEGEGLGDESEPEEDDIQDAVDGEETTGEVTVGGGDANANIGDNEGGDSGEGSESGSDDEDDDELDLSSYIQAPLKDKKKQTGVEIFVGGLNRKAVEDDLIKVFGELGEIKAVRIVKHPVTKRSKGYAFISYATVEQAQKVLTDLKDGIEVMGKRAGVSPSQDSDTLYMGNISKAWTKEQVLETLKGFGIENFEEIYIPEDPKSEGKIRGFAYMEFLTHSDAMAAFQRLRKPDAVFGRNRSAKVAFAPSMHPSEEALSQVKTVYVEGLTDSWSEEKLKQLCEQYGEVEKVQLSRDLVTVKRKDFGFVSFTSRENALACVGAINNAEIGEGEIKIKANIAKPQYKGRLGKNARGGYKVEKDGEKVEESGKSKAEGGGKGRGNKRKEKVPPRLKNRGAAAGAPKEKEEAGKGRKRDGRNTNSRPSERPSKKPRGNGRGGGRAMNVSGNRGKSFHSGRGRQGPRYDRAPAAYVDPYARGYPASVPSYSGHAYSAVSDMEPHAGYLKPASQGRDPYDYRLRRAGGYVPQGGGATSYVGGGSMLPPPSYAPGYSRYAAYESGSAGRYGYAPSSSGGYSHGRPYY